MSKEVSVTGINMTATVPETLEISLGDGMNHATAPKLTVTTDSNRLTGVTEPGGDDNDPDWSNTVAISDFYTLGKLTPATSKTGASIYYTQDVTGVGKSLKGQSIGADGKLATESITAAFTEASANATKAMAAVAANTTKGTPVELTDPYAKNGGYYVDIPVWFRTSTKDTSGVVELAVKATYTANSNTAGNRDETTRTEDLYKAARVSIIKGAGSVPTVANTSATVKELASDTNTVSQGVLYTTGADTNGFASGYYSEDAATSAGRGTSGTANTWDGSAWTAVTKIAEATVTEGTYTTGTGDTVVAVPKATGTNNYGTPVRYTIRVWLDGEDKNCWNATAGQDFNIQLSFYDKSGGTAAAGGGN